MTRKPAPPAAAASAASSPPGAKGGRVYMLRIWTATPLRQGFRALVRPVESEQWLGFTDAAELLAYLQRSEPPSNKDEP
jgi:hypothetical protein